MPIIDALNGLFFFLLQRLNCSRKVVMQVFTRCVNSAIEADAVISFWFVVHANDMIPRWEKKNTATKNTQASNKTTTKKNKQKTQTHKQNKTRTKESRWNDIFKAVMRRSDQATCVPRPEQVIHEATAQSQTLTRWPRGAKQKSRNAETRDPPSQDPGDRITKPFRHDKHRCISIASICRAVWKTKWWNSKWNGSETYRVRMNSSNI